MSLDPYGRSFVVLFVLQASAFHSWSLVRFVLISGSLDHPFPGCFSLPSGNPLRVVPCLHFSRKIPKDPFFSYLSSRPQVFHVVLSGFSFFDFFSSGVVVAGEGALCFMPVWAFAGWLSSSLPRGVCSVKLFRPPLSVPCPSFTG